MAYQMANQLQQQQLSQQPQQSQQSQQSQQPQHPRYRQTSPGAVTASVAGLCTAGEFVTPKTPRQHNLTSASPQTSTAAQVVDRKKEVMGLLRNGKAYSPCGKGNEPEKRRLSLSAEKETPTAKRRETGNQPIVMMRSLSSSSLNRDSAVDMDITLKAFMTKMESLVNNTLTKMRKENSEIMNEVKAESGRIKSMADNALKDIKNEGEKYMSEVKLESSRLTKEISSLQKTSQDQAKTLTNLKKSINSVEKDLTACFEDTKETVKSQGQRLIDIENKLDEIPETSDGVDARLKSLEKIAAELSTKIDNISVDGEAELYPLRRSIVATQVHIKQDETPVSVAELLINDVLGLTGIKVIRAEIVDDYGDGNCTIKVLLDSADSVRRVLEAKTMLQTCDEKNIRSIWIRRSKSNEQRMLERNCALLLREVDKEGKYRQTGHGRIVRVTRTAEKSARSQEDIFEGVSSEVSTSGASLATDAQFGRRRGGGVYPRGRGGRGGRSRKPVRGRGDRRLQYGDAACPNNPSRPKIQVNSHVLERLSRGQNQRSESESDQVLMDTTPGPGQVQQE